MGSHLQTEGKREREGQTKTEEDEEMFLHNEKVGPFIKITSL